MPNHFHLLVKIKEYNPTSDFAKQIIVKKTQLNPIEKGFKDFLISYSKSINKAYDRTGSLFSPKLKKKVIANVSYIQNIIAYIHLNPVRAGISKQVEKWKFSSYSSYINLNNNILNINVNEVFSWFNGKENFIEFHEIFRDFLTERDNLYNDKN